MQENKENKKNKKTASFLKILATIIIVVLSIYIVEYEDEKLNFLNSMDQSYYPMLITPNEINTFKEIKFDTTKLSYEFKIHHSDISYNLIHLEYNVYYNNSMIYSIEIEDFLFSTDARKSDWINKAFLNFIRTKCESNKVNIFNEFDKSAHRNFICNDKYSGSHTVIRNKNVIYTIWYYDNENIYKNNLFIGLVKEKIKMLDQTSLYKNPTKSK
jgi:hypothetical protein